jgi:hypothetical protein
MRFLPTTEKMYSLPPHSTASGAEVFKKCSIQSVVFKQRTIVMDMREMPTKRGRSVIYCTIFLGNYVQSHNVN